MTYVTTDFTVPYLNFSAEYFLATEKDMGDIFMLWRNEPSVIVGRYQNTYEEVNLGYTEANGIHVARRMSGGGTVYHDLGCWEFSFITRDPGYGIDFGRFMAPVAEALSGMGLNVEISGRNDILLFPRGGDRGYKVSGNTQYKKNGVTVHHGTLLFDTDIEELVKSTTPKDYKITSKAIRSVRERVTNIRPNLPQDMTREEFRDSLASRMTDVSYTLTDDDLAKIKKGAGMFSSPEWIYGKNPAFGIKASVSASGGMADIGLDVKGGLIAEASVTGDFFSDFSGDPGECLRGAPFSRDGIIKAFIESGCSIRGIPAEMIAEAVFR